MRSPAPPLLPIFRSAVQGKLLATLLDQPARQWSLEELAESTGEPYQTIATEIRRLEHAELLTSIAVGRKKLVSANQASPYLRQLSELAIMAFGPPVVIARAFAEVAHIEAIYIYGSWAARYQGQPGHDPKDIDLLIIGTPDRDAVYNAARVGERQLGRSVNVTMRTAAQWRAGGDSFAAQLKASPMVQVPYRASHGGVGER